MWHKNYHYQEISSAKMKISIMNIKPLWYTWDRSNKTLGGYFFQTLTLISVPPKWDIVLLWQHKEWIGPLTGFHEVVAIDYCIGCRIIKPNKLLIYLLLFPLLVDNLTVITPCTITVIEMNKPFVLILVVFHGGCCQIFHIWDNKLLGDPFWNIYYWLLGWIPIRTIYIRS